MTRQTRSVPLALLLPIIVGAVALLVAANNVGAADPVRLLPNLQALPAKDFRVSETAAGWTELRFSTTSWNNGAGPLELRPDGPLGQDVRVLQRIYLEGGGYEDIDSGVFSFDEGDGHNHFHFQNYAAYRLYEVKADGSEVPVGSASKTTFCIIDTDRIDHKLPGAPKRGVYISCSTDVQGMSVGWGDTYRYTLGGQAIIVPGSLNGTYVVEIEIDTFNNLLESNEDPSDNTSRVTIVIDSAAGTVQVEGAGPPGQGNGRGRPPR